MSWLRDGVFVFSVTPLDVVKIRLQAQRTPFSKGKPCRHLPQGAAPGVSQLAGLVAGMSLLQSVGPP